MGIVAMEKEQRLPRLSDDCMCVQQRHQDPQPGAAAHVGAGVGGRAGRVRARLHAGGRVRRAAQPQADNAALQRCAMRLSDVLAEAGTP